MFLQLYSEPQTPTRTVMSSVLSKLGEKNPNILETGNENLARNNVT